MNLPGRTPVCLLKESLFFLSREIEPVFIAVKKSLDIRSVLNDDEYGKHGEDRRNEIFGFTSIVQKPYASSQG